MTTELSFVVTPAKKPLRLCGRSRKEQLARDLLEGGAELDLAALGDAELLRLVALDLGAARME